MNTLKESFPELHTTDINYARIRVTIESPNKPYSVTTSLHIPEHMIEDFAAEQRAREYLDTCFRSNLSNSEHEILRATHLLHEAEHKARNTRSMLSNLVTRSLSDAFAKEATK